jgi:hypothetical protein
LINRVSHWNLKNHSQSWLFYSFFFWGVLKKKKLGICCVLILFVICLLISFSFEFVWKTWSLTNVTKESKSIFFFFLWYRKLWMWMTWRIDKKKPCYLITVIFLGMCYWEFSLTSKMLCKFIFFKNSVSCNIKVHTLQSLV